MKILFLSTLILCLSVFGCDGIPINVSVAACDKLPEKYIEQSKYIEVGKMQIGEERYVAAWHFRIDKERNLYIWKDKTTHAHKSYINAVKIVRLNEGYEIYFPENERVTMDHNYAPSGDYCEVPIKKIHIVKE